ncbi:hypothetical protein PR002_g5664 [Phytophthora rubi]|uniref:Uncharacterized protein n=1 Tax=Phytophthora rubi TaxID=129364 RepID=A0A6A3N6Q4_9STRA|nr:hypothetical protein PR002_g5664 [Phytophthora rubi]
MAPRVWLMLMLLPGSMKNGGSDHLLHSRTRERSHCLDCPTAAHSPVYPWTPAPPSRSSIPDRTSQSRPSSRCTTAGSLHSFL